jgi:hypothetical protein
MNATKNLDAIKARLHDRLNSGWAEAADCNTAKQLKQWLDSRLEDVRNEAGEIEDRLEDLKDDEAILQDAIEELNGDDEENDDEE